MRNKRTSIGLSIALVIALGLTSADGQFVPPTPTHEALSVNATTGEITRDANPTGTWDFTSGTITVNDADLPSTLTRDSELTALAAAITQTDAETVTALNNKTYAAGRALQVADTIDISTLPTITGDFALVFTASTGIRISGTDTTIEVNAGDISVTLGATTRTYTATIAGRARWHSPAQALP